MAFIYHTPQAISKNFYLCLKQKHCHSGESRNPVKQNNLVISKSNSDEKPQDFPTLRSGITHKKFVQKINPFMKQSFDLYVTLLKNKFNQNR